MEWETKRMYQPRCTPARSRALRPRFAWFSKPDYFYLVGAVFAKIGAAQASGRAIDPATESQKTSYEQLH